MFATFYDTMVTIPTKTGLNIFSQAATPMLPTEFLPSQPINVLLVDDQLIIYEALKQLLASETDLKLHYCADPSEAIPLANRIFPTVILQDLVMPGLDGLALVRYFRANTATRNVPLIVLSSKEDPGVKAEAFALGANDYMVKLPDRLEIIARLRYHAQGFIHFLQRNAAMRELEAANAQITALNEKLASENVRMRTELEVSRHLQQMLLPHDADLRVVQELEIAGFMQPADEVGGDYYDIIPTDDGDVFISIGDVTGHGLESGVLAIMAQMGVRVLLAAGYTQAKHFFPALNTALHANVQRMKSNKNMSLALLRYQQNHLEISGQHESVLLVHKGQLQIVETDELGFLVGFMQDITPYVQQAQLPFTAGDALVLYSDGIVEAENPQREEYGLPRLCELLSRHWQKSAQALQTVILNDVRQHIASQKLFDDMTLVILKRR